MELSRLLRVLRDRWYIVVGLGLLGFLAGWYFTDLANQNREQQIQATIGLRFEAQEGQTADALQTEREFTLERATQAAGEFLVDDPTNKVEVDQVTGRLVFRAVGNTREEAQQKAQILVDAYLNVDPSVGGASVDERLATIVSQAESLQAQIEEIQPPLSVEDQALVDQHTRLDQQIALASEQLDQLRIEEFSATPAEQADATARRENLEDELTALLADKSDLPAAPASLLSIGDQMRLASLQNGLTMLAAEYEQLNLRGLGIIDSGNLDPVDFLALTGPAPVPLINGLIGMLGGVAIAVLALVFITRGTKPVWMPEDLEIPFLGEVPSRRLTSGVGEAWYDTTEGGPRKPAIQALRSVVEAQLPSTGATLAVSGHNVAAQGVHALTTDLAVSMASAGSSVLLVDADFASDSAVVEYRVGGSSLSGVLALNPDSIGFDRSLATAVADSLFVRPGLAVVPSGPPPSSPGDALAGRQFRAFIEEATRTFDIVIVAVGDIGSPAAQVAMQRLRRSLLVLTPGRSTAPQVNGLVFDIVQRQVTIMGAVFLERSERGLWGLPERRLDKVATAETTHVAKHASPMTRLSHYPSPVARGTSAPPQDSLTHLVDRIGTLQEAATTADFGRELLAALDGASTEVAYEAVAEYLVSRVEDMMTEGYGEGDFSDAVIDEISLSGFLPFRSLTEHPSVGRWLMDELHHEVAPTTADAIVLEMEQILAAGKGVDELTVDEWLTNEFFLRHLKRTAGDPSIWHLTSEEGAVQVLVPARRFDRQKIENLMTQVTSRVIDELERTLKATNVRGDEEQAALLEGKIREVRRMETSLALLLGITVDETTKVSRKRTKGEAWEWNPDWSLGYRANLASLQRLDLLLFPVLTEDEMNSLLATG